MGLRDNVSNRPTFLGFIFILGKMTVYLGLTSKIVIKTSNVLFYAFYFVFSFELIRLVSLVDIDLVILDFFNEIPYFLYL